MASVSSSRLVHRVAVFTATVALLPITVGALVTTMQWGMAFADWPTSDGQGMFAYPWLGDLRVNPNKFTEHGHRLAGILIGCCSILLAAVAWWREDRRAARWLATAILLGVILQGLMGGNRVLRNDPRWALVHGSFAAVVFTMMCGMAVVTGRRWKESLGKVSDFGDHEAGYRGTDATGTGEVVSDMLRPLVIAAPLVFALQYVLGGFVRHLHMALHEHLGGAVLAGLVGAFAAMAGLRSRVPQVSRLGRWLGLSLVCQILLGAGAWVTRFGFPMLAVVAVNGSRAQALFRTAHAVTGMLVLASSVLLAVSVIAVERSRGAVSGTPAGAKPPRGRGLAREGA